MQRIKKTVEDHITNFIGSRRFVVGQTVVFVAWTAWNIIAAQWLRFDRYPFVFLNLFMSAEAAYATSIILMSSSKQERIDHDMLRETHRLAKDARKHAVETQQQGQAILALLAKLDAAAPCGNGCAFSCEAKDA